MERRTRISFLGRFKWVPLLLLPFSVFFFEVWTQTRTLACDYAINDLSKRRQELVRHIDILKVEEAELKSLDRIEAKAPNLGLVEPEPGQIEVISASGGHEIPSYGRENYTLATLGGLADE